MANNLNINIADLNDVIKRKVEYEKLSKFFKIRNYQYKGKHLDLNQSNSILMEFPTPKDEFPDIYTSTAYRVLFILALYQEKKFSHPLQNELKRIEQKNNIDKIVLWSATNIDNETLQLLKNINVDVIQYNIDILTKENKSISNFIILPSNQPDYSVMINSLSEYIIKRLKKLFHVVLSEIAAPIYDEHYAKTKVATKSLMEFEERQLQKLIKKLQSENKSGIAVDVGCGTGRHSFILSKYFNTVYAFDFSPRMIEKANEEKRRQNIENIIFSVNDFEYEKLLDEKDFYGKCDLIVASFGMGSFIEDTVKMLRRFYDWLKPGGYIFLSFYNENSLILKIVPNWRDTSLSAHIDTENKTLTVELTPSIKFNIYCKPYNEATKGEINKMFNIDQIYTYPTLMSLLPNSLLEEELAYNIFKYVDDLLATNSDYVFGHYVIVIAHKPEVVTTGYSNILQYIEENNAKYEIIEHEPVLSIEDVKKEIGYFPGCMVKTIIFKIKKSNQFIAIALPAEKKVNKEVISQALNVSKGQIKFAPEKDVIKLGFPLGGIAPFGFNEERYNVEKFIDKKLINSKCLWFYMGIGDNRKTLKIHRDSFLKIVSSYRSIEL